jgi:D-alanyl-lipoteichoic acid acyltransferase DltB (MBOAT superfamily)
MSFTSFALLLGFLPMVVIGAHLLRDRFSARAAQRWIVGASIVFYATNGVRYLPLLLASAAFNWAVARAMDKAASPSNRKRLLVFGLAVDILVLCAFKYVRFLAGMVGGIIGHDFALPSWAFPLGISFWTLSQVMYLVDCYEKLTPAGSLFDHTTLVSFFANVTAGPLERSKHFRPQLPEIAAAEGRDQRIVQGIALMALGLFSKVVFAESFARVANAGYAHAATLSTVEAWVTSLAYTFQLYFDFAGYSAMAFGVAKLLGLTLIQNFDAPYRAKTITEFWQRWHISLSSFITTYLYTPIIRSMGRVNIRKAAVATLIAMTLAGLWHGPAWTFVLYGTLHGIALATNQYWRRRKTPLPTLLAIALTFVFVNVSLILFRAPSLGAAAAFARRLLPVERLFDLSQIVTAIPSASAFMIAIPLVAGSIAAFAGPTSFEIAAKVQPSYRVAAGIAVLVGISFMFMLAGGGSDFVYRAF